MGFISHFLAGGLFNRSEMNKKLDEISDALTPSWKLIDTIDNTVGYSGTWTAPDVFGDGSAYDLGVYMIGGGQSGAARSYPNTGATAEAKGGNSGYGKNVVIENVNPGDTLAWVVGKGGSTATISSATSSNGNRWGYANNGGTTSFGGHTADGGNDVGGGQGAITRASYPISYALYASVFDYTLTASGTQQTPAESQNRFDPSMVTLCGGGYAVVKDVSTTNIVKALPDGTKGGDGKSFANASGSAESATGYGNGGGAVALFVSSGTRTVNSGAGSDGAIFLYARKAVNTNA